MGNFSNLQARLAGENLECCSGPSEAVRHGGGRRTKNLQGEGKKEEKGGKKEKRVERERERGENRKEREREEKMGKKGRGEQERKIY